MYERVKTLLSGTHNCFEGLGRIPIISSHNSHQFSIPRNVRVFYNDGIRSVCDAEQRTRVLESASRSNVEYRKGRMRSRRIIEAQYSPPVARPIARITKRHEIPALRYRLYFPPARKSWDAKT